MNVSAAIDEQAKKGEPRHAQLVDWDPDVCSVRLHNGMKGAPAVEKHNWALLHWLSLAHIQALFF
jgi:hypothetical protein